MRAPSSSYNCVVIKNPNSNTMQCVNIESPIKLLFFSVPFFRSCEEPQSIPYQCERPRHARDINLSSKVAPSSSSAPFQLLTPLREIVRQILQRLLRPGHIGISTFTAPQAWTKQKRGKRKRKALLLRRNLLHNLQQMRRNLRIQVHPRLRSTHARLRRRRGRRR